MESKFILSERIMWEKCWSERACVHVPFDGSKCVEIKACVRIILESNTYFIELQLFSGRKRFQLINKCYDVYTVGIGSLEVCTADVKIEGERLISLTISVKGCVGAGPIHQCWPFFNQPVHFFYLSGEKTSFDGNALIEGYNDIAYSE